MTRRQALILSIIAGLVALTFVFMIVLLIVPPEQIIPVFTPTATPTLRPTPTPTLPNFMPTPSLETPAPAVPTPTNTRLPTATAQPSASPTPTAEFALDLLTPFVRPTATLTPTVPPPPTQPPPTPTLPGGRQYSISFNAGATTIDKGGCTNLRWNVQGVVSSVQLDGRPVDSSGLHEVCPQQSTTYVLTIRLEDSGELKRRPLQIIVK